MKIGIASDHRGYELKGKLIKYLSNKNFQIFDFGTNSKESVDYPKYAFKLGEGVVNGVVDFGIAICGTGIGISIACNKVKGIRCAKVSTSNEAKMTRLHNDANILALNGDMPLYRAKDIVDAFFSTNFSNEEKHINRIKQITDYENNNNLIKKQIREEKEKKILEEQETVEEEKRIEEKVENKKQEKVEEKQEEIKEEAKLKRTRKKKEGTKDE